LEDVMWRAARARIMWRTGCGQFEGNCGWECGASLLTVRMLESEFDLAASLFSEWFLFDMIRELHVILAHVPVV
jgi:hypothetical protein